jgi:putative tricarboxylic transport membrane protein
MSEGRVKMNSEVKRHKLMQWPEFLTGLILWGIVGVLLLTTMEMPFIEPDKTPGPRFLPVIVASVLALLTIIYWVEAFKKRKRTVEIPNLGKLIKPAAFVGMSFLIVLLWEIIGAVPVIMLVSFLEFKLLEKYTWKRSLIVALILSVFAYVVFKLVLGIPLPSGIFK